MNNRGVYFIANDTVLENAIAFLNSFRMYNPSLPLCLIPYNDTIVQLLELQREYAFSVWSDDSLFRECAAISETFHGYEFGHYRKLAIWEGPFDEFIYVDTDTVILESLDFAFRFLNDYAVVTSHSNISVTRHWVWKDSIETIDSLTKAQRDFAANTGFICSKKGLLPLSKAQEAVPRALAIVEHMELFCIEQPFLNFLIVTSGVPYTSLYWLHENGHETVLLEQWAGNKLTVMNGRVCDHPRVFMVHWAGEWERAKSLNRRVQNYALWAHYRHLRNSLKNK